MVVDDRIAIIGSANINERSQRGDRDSELACIIRDTDMIDSTMGGKPYQVGRFAHTMRVRLMREHLGIDVDELESNEGREELLAREAKSMKTQEDEWDPDNEQKRGDESGTQPFTKRTVAQNVKSATKEYTGGVATGIKEAVSLGIQKGSDNLRIDKEVHRDRVDDDPVKESLKQETKADRIVRGEEASEGFASSVVPTLEEKMMLEGRPNGDAVAKEGDEPQGRQQADREREDGVNVQAGWQKRQIEEGRDDAATDEKEELSTRSNGIDGADPKLTVQRLQGFTNENSPHTDADAKKFRGHPVDQSSKITDSREIEQSGSNENGAPLSPISEGQDADNEPASKDRELNGDFTHPGKPSDENAPSDIANADKPDAQRRGSNTQADSNQSAASRNKVTSAIRRNLKERGAYTVPLAKPKVDPHGFADPLVDTFYKDVWLAAAVRNTQIFRKVFRTMPDDLVQTWKQYREFQAWAERHNKVGIVFTDFFFLPNLIEFFYDFPAASQGCRPARRRTSSHGSEWSLLSARSRGRRIFRRSDGSRS
jgi:phospholipase D1/2